eukprot:1849241-Pyramimonas_sp.AAC.1
MAALRSMRGAVEPLSAPLRNAILSASCIPLLAAHPRTMRKRVVLIGGVQQSAVGTRWETADSSQTQLRK